MRISPRSVRFYWPLLALPMALGLAEQEARAVNIYVTNLQQKVTGTGGCSLQEAIYSANLRTNQAVDHINSDGSDNVITTQCVAGTGNDTIVLPVGATFTMSTFVPDSHNYLGPTATPLIFSNITLEANGSLLQWTGTAHVRAFAIGPVGPGGAFNTTGSLTLRNAYIKGFNVKGGDGACGGGGGMGAGGAIYVAVGQLTIENSTFEANSATGGNGGVVCSSPSDPNGGGGGGLSGNGGFSNIAGGGGGGALGNGGSGGFFVAPAPGFPSGSAAGGGGGGTLTKGSPGGNDGLTGPGGVLCGGNGGHANQQGSAAPCAGGGGGGGGVSTATGNAGGDGGYGGGGGGNGRNPNSPGIAGGKGGLGGGGGSGGDFGSGGPGGFGGGGGGG